MCSPRACGPAHRADPGIQPQGQAVLRVRRPRTRAHHCTVGSPPPLPANTCAEPCTKTSCTWRPTTHIRSMTRARWVPPRRAADSTGDGEVCVQRAHPGSDSRADPHAPVSLNFSSWPCYTCYVLSIMKGLGKGGFICVWFVCNVLHCILFKAACNGVLTAKGTGRAAGVRRPHSAPAEGERPFPAIACVYYFRAL